MSRRTKSTENTAISRRGFLKASGTMAAVAGGAAAGCGAAQPSAAVSPGPLATSDPESSEGADTSGPRIRSFRTLGRTGFKVSDLSMGCGRIAEANVVRYAYDHGVNFFDTAEGYGNGDSERKIGEAMAHMEREKIFIVTKLKIENENTEQSILERFGKCLERLNTKYVDALYTHAVTNVEMVKNEAFHRAAAKLKAEGKIRHVGISSHGPRGDGQDSMEKVLLAAVDDGRFDLMLFVYSFLKSEEAERVLAACKEKNIGTTAMKVYAGKLEVETFDPKSPTVEQLYFLDVLKKRGMGKEEAIAYLSKRYQAGQKEMEEQKPAIDSFVAEHGVKTQDELDAAAIRWVLKNEEMHTICVSMPDFNSIDKTLPLSGTELTAANSRLLRDCATVFGRSYCRHGCVECLAACPRLIPVSTVMRYAYYFARGGREKPAMEKYARLRGLDGSFCLDCAGHCLEACPYGVPIQATMLKAHGMLTLA